MWFSYAGFKRSLAKLNIKHRMCCNKPINYKMLPSFSHTSLPGCVGKEVTLIYWGIGSAILGYSVSAGK